MSIFLRVHKNNIADFVSLAADHTQVTIKASSRDVKLKKFIVITSLVVGILALLVAGLSVWCTFGHLPSFLPSFLQGINAISQVGYIGQGVCFGGGVLLVAFGILYRHYKLKKAQEIYKDLLSVLLTIDGIGKIKGVLGEKEVVLIDKNGSYIFIDQERSIEPKDSKHFRNLSKVFYKESSFLRSKDILEKLNPKK